MQEWSFAGMDGAAVTAPNVLGAVTGNVDIDYHRTARVQLRELSPGSLAGNTHTHFEFGEGIQILGAQIWLVNYGQFFGVRDESNQGHVWYDGRSTGAGRALNANIMGNTMSIRPQFQGQRDRLVTVRFRFYVSIIPGYEAMFGPDIEATVIHQDFEDSVAVAEAWDPIRVYTNPVTIDDLGEGVFGQFRQESIGDVVVVATSEDSLGVGDILWLGVEGGIGRGWGGADHVSIRALSVSHCGLSPNLAFSAPRVDSHGVSVQVLRGFTEPGTEIVFHDVEISGRLLPGHTYGIIVAGDAVADNWAQFDWLEPGVFTRLGRGRLHGFFDDEPYHTEAFSFAGADQAFTAGPGPGVTPPVTPPRDNVVTPGPVTFRLGSSHLLRDGDTVEAPVFVVVPNVTNPRYVTSYVAARVVADLAGFPWEVGFSYWDAAARRATFGDGTMSVVFEADSTTAVVNGVPTEITAGGLVADARIINGRMFVPISFFNTLPGFPVSVRWNPYVNQADRSITITPTR